eukprot:s2060_g2.t2
MSKETELIVSIDQALWPKGVVRSLSGVLRSLGDKHGNIVIVAQPTKGHIMVKGPADKIEEAKPGLRAIIEEHFPDADCPEDRAMEVEEPKAPTPAPAPAPAPMPAAPAAAKSAPAAPAKAKASVPEPPAEKVVISGPCQARKGRVAPHASPDLLWHCMSKSSCFVRPGGVNNRRGLGLEFSAEPGNLMGLHSFQYSGLANPQALDVRPKKVGKKESIELADGAGVLGGREEVATMPLLRPFVLQAARRAAGRGLATSAVRSHRPMAVMPQVSEEDSMLPRAPMAASGSALMAGSPLFLTDLDAPMYWTEIQFVLSGPINGLFERMFETEAGPLFLNGVFLVTLLRMGVYYGFMQPAYLWHFQERYGQTWTVGHHLHGSDLPNPLKKKFIVQGLAIQGLIVAWQGQGYQARRKPGSVLVATGLSKCARKGGARLDREVLGCSYRPKLHKLARLKYLKIGLSFKKTKPRKIIRPCGGHVAASFAVLATGGADSRAPVRTLRLCLRRKRPHCVVLVAVSGCGRSRGHMSRQAQRRHALVAFRAPPAAALPQALRPREDSQSLVAHQGPIAPIGAADLAASWEGIGGHLQRRDVRTISVVLPCAEERENAIWTVERFCRRTPAEHLQEVIVVDDGSNPPLEQLFQQSEDKWAQDPQCKGKVRFLRHETTTGLMAAKLTGGREARGDVIAFIDCHCAPQPNWHQEILAQVRLNPRRMVVPAITDLDLDTFDERADSQVNAKCYLTLDADFKWFDDESDFIPTISGGLVAMGREWFNATGGFDEEMHGWGGENLDQSLRAWLCGGDIVRAKTSRVAHMWRTGKDRRTATHYVIKAKGTNNRGRVVAAWFGPFREVSRSSVKEDQVQNYNGFKKRLHCLPFSYFLYRFRKLYIEGGVIAREYFRLQEAGPHPCITTEVNVAGVRGVWGDGGPGVEAELNEPQHVAVQQDKVFIADRNNQRDLVTTVPVGVAVSADGSMAIISDEHSESLLVLDLLASPRRVRVLQGIGMLQDPKDVLGELEKHVLLASRAPKVCSEATSVYSGGCIAQDVRRILGSGEGPGDGDTERRLKPDL